MTACILSKGHKYSQLMELGSQTLDKSLFWSFFINSHLPFRRVFSTGRWPRFSTFNSPFNGLMSAHFAHHRRAKTRFDDLSEEDRPTTPMLVNRMVRAATGVHEDGPPLRHLRLDQLCTFIRIDCRSLRNSEMTSNCLKQSPAL